MRNPKIFSNRFDGVIFDIDNTAVPEGALTITSEPLLKAFLNFPADKAAIAATARTTTFALPLLRALDMSHESVVANGAQIIDPRTGMCNWKRFLNKKQAEAIIAICEPYDYRLAIAGDRLGSTNTASESHARKTAGIFLMDTPLEVATEVKTQIGTLPDVHVYISKSWQDDKEVYDVNIGHAEARKGRTLKVLLDRYGLDPRRMVMVGDSENDIDMFGLGGYNIAVANAEPLLISIADEVVPSQKDNGLAVVMRRF